MPEVKVAESTARRAAKRVGLLVRKSRRRRGSADNCGGFMSLNPYRNTIIAGVRFDLSAEHVVRYCEEVASRASTYG
jgi:hypothetical protein